MVLITIMNSTLILPEEVFSSHPLTSTYFVSLSPHSSEAVEDEADPYLRHAVLEGALGVGEEDAPPAHLRFERLP